MSDELKEEKGLTAKQIKALAKPEFAANPDKFYPTSTLRRLGFERATCTVPNEKGEPCGHNYWRHTPKKTTCGDSQCEKKYSFIGVGTGKGRGANGTKITYAEAWEGFSRSLSTARVPCTPIKRYPVVARWRADVDYVAAGIFCFQPYCVTGELQPPANPLICPQFCLRFNDLDNIGLTGRHYSGFVMLGIQVFNSKDNYKFWNHECVEFNYRWLTEELKIDPDEITFIEDVWAGGGNLGPSIEFFVGGLELGNMVFMQYKTFPDGRREPLQVQVIDVGIGLERVPWLINGSATSYCDVFPRALQFMLEKTGLSISNDIWERFGPYSCLLNVDEVSDVEETWAWIGKQIGVSADKIKAAIEPIRDIYMVLDHTRSVLMAIEDGSLPSNVGGASNIRNVLRRCFQLMEKHGWWEKIPIDTVFMELFAKHRADLATLYGEFRPYPSFDAIIKLEWTRWKFTDDKQKLTLTAMLKKQGGKLALDDWIRCITTFGLPAEVISKTSGLPIPGNLWYAIAELQETTVKVAPTQLYSTAHLKPTESLYFTQHKKYDFDATILEVFPNVTAGNIPNIVVLDRSSFYPTSGGQEHDTGKLTVEGVTYDVVDVLKVGPAVLHVLNKPLPKSTDFYKGKKVSGVVDAIRREQLRNNHTATHIVFAACRRVLGPHVWQHGAKKTVKKAHLDITHYDSLSFKQMQDIENAANRIVHQCRDISKGWFAKDVAEQKHGFTLYQGGIVPGNEVRVVHIDETDTEACCGTHADNTAEVGTIKLIKTKRTSDGVVRLYYVAGERALKRLNKTDNILSKLITSWGVTPGEVVDTATRFFHESKSYKTQVNAQSKELLELQLKCLLLDPSQKLAIYKTSESQAGMFISNVGAFAAQFRDSKKGVVFLGHTFLYAFMGDATAYDWQGAFQQWFNAAVVAEDARLAAKQPKKVVEAKVDDAEADSDSDSDDDKPAAPTKAAPKGEAKEEKKKSSSSGIQFFTQAQAKAADGKGKVKVEGILEVRILSFPAGIREAIFEQLVEGGFFTSEPPKKKEAPKTAAAKKEKAPKAEAKGELEEGKAKAKAEAKPAKKPKAEAAVAPAKADGAAEAVAPKAEAAKKGSKAKKEAAAPAAEAVVAEAKPTEEAPKKGGKKDAKKEAKKEATPAPKVEAAPAAAVEATPAPAPAAAVPKAEERPKSAKPKAEAKKEEKPKEQPKAAKKKK